MVMENSAKKDDKPVVGATKLRHAIHEKFEHILLWDATDIRVRVSKGIVTLMGTVAEHDDLKKAEEVVLGIEGVKGVKNNLKIKRPGLASVISEFASQLTSVMTDEEHEYPHSKLSEHKKPEH